MKVCSNSTLNLSRYDIIDNTLEFDNLEELNKKLEKNKNIPIPIGSSRTSDGGWVALDENNNFYIKIHEYILIRFRYEEKKIPTKKVKEILNNKLKQNTKKLTAKERANLKELILSDLIPNIPVDTKELDIIFDKRKKEFTVLSNSKNLIGIIETHLSITFSKFIFRPKYYDNNDETKLTAFNKFITWIIWKIETKKTVTQEKYFLIYTDKKMSLSHQSTNCKIINSDSPQKTIEALNSLAIGSKVSEASFLIELSNEKTYNNFLFSLSKNKLSPIKLKLPKVDLKTESSDAILLIKLDCLYVINRIIDEMYEKYISEVTVNKDLFLEIKNYFKDLTNDF